MFAICPKRVYLNNDLTSTDIRVYIAIQGFANKDGYCYPSIEKIASICGVKRRTIERSLKRLEESDVLKREKRIDKKGGYTSNGYYLNLYPNDVTNSNQDDTSFLTHTIRQECRTPYVKNVATNNKTINENIFINKNKTRACNARDGGENAAELSKKAKQILELEDLRDVKDCLEKVPAAADYKFFKTQDGVIGCRPSWKFAQDVETEKRIRRFFEFTAKREIWIAKFGEFSIDEININFESEV